MVIKLNGRLRLCIITAIILLAFAGSFVVYAADEPDYQSLAKGLLSKTALKTTMKKFEAAVTEGNKEAAADAYKVAVKTVDRAAGKGLLHKNNAARKKSAMAGKLNGLN